MATMISPDLKLLEIATSIYWNNMRRLFLLLVFWGSMPAFLLIHFMGLFIIL